VAALDLAEWRSAPASHERVYVQGTGLSQMLQSWLAYARATDAGMLRRSWWVDRARQRQREKQRFGATLRGRPGEPPSAEVVAVEPGSPAASVLSAGDVIVGVEGEPLVSTRPAREVVERFRGRAADERFEIEVARDRGTVPRRAAIPPPADRPEFLFNPPAVIRPLSAVARRIHWLAISSHRDSPRQRTARVVVRWQSPREEVHR
jgi:hypothetical protein